MARRTLLLSHGAPGTAARFFLAAAVLLSSCASLRSSPILPIDFSSQPPRSEIRGFCNGQDFTTQGTVVCEQKAPSTATISVKVPPLEGRVVYSNGQLKKTDDFNWYPKQGFWLWKKKPLKDTWADLDLGEIAATFGDWPVALDIMAVGPTGLVNTRGILYHRICNDQDIPCSRLVVQYECAGHSKATGPGLIGKCERLSGSAQAFVVSLADAKPGAMIYLIAHRIGLKEAVPVTADDLKAGFKKVEVTPILSGPTLIDFGLDWVEGAGTHHEETRVLMVGFDPSWTGLDRPHYLDQGDHLDWTMPVLADIMETDLYQGRTLIKKSFGADKVQSSVKPADGQLACAFAWQRSSSDLTAQCLDSTLKEVPVP